MDPIKLRLNRGPLNRAPIVPRGRSPSDLRLFTEIQAQAYVAAQRRGNFIQSNRNQVDLLKHVYNIHSTSVRTQTDVFIWLQIDRYMVNTI